MVSFYVANNTPTLFSCKEKLHQDTQTVLAEHLGFIGRSKNKLQLGDEVFIQLSNISKIAGLKFADIIIPVAAGARTNKPPRRNTGVFTSAGLCPDDRHLNLLQPPC